MAGPVTHENNSRIAPGRMLEPFAQFAKQTLQRRNSRSARRSWLAPPSGRGGLGMIAGMKEGSGLPSQVQSVSIRTIFKTGRAARQRDRPLDERPQLFGLRHGRDASILARIDPLYHQAPQPRHALLR